MNVAEATRQYQIALEHRRTLRAACEGSVSFEDEITEAELGLAEAYAQLEIAWCDRAVA